MLRLSLRWWIAVAGLWIAFIGCTHAGSSPIDSPAPISTLTPTATSVQQSTYEELSADFAQLLARAAELRGLQPVHEIPARLMGSIELRGFLDRTLADEYSRTDALVDQEVYILLDLLQESDDLYEILLNLYGEQVIGLYDTDTRDLIVRSESFSLGPQERTTLIHEYTHALQDQHHNLSQIYDQTEGNEDFSAAVSALVEGDATLTEVLYVNSDISNEERHSMFENIDTPVFDAAPRVIRLGLLFPYQAGMEFVIALRAHEQEQEWDMVNRAYSDPPRSTEQILHPEKYLDLRDDPKALTNIDLDSALGPAWVQQDADVLGELGLRIMLGTYIGSEQAAAAAAGWGGDYYTYLTDNLNRQVLVLQTIWDTGADAREFAKAYVAFVSEKSGGTWDTLHDTDAIKWWMAEDGSTVYMKRFGPNVLIVIAPDASVSGVIAAQFK